MKYIDLENIKEELIKKKIKNEETFKFLCYKKITCFNQCCANLNMFLYPYDVIRLKKNLKKDSNSFIQKHVDIILRKGNYFPDVLLRMNINDKMKCPFLKNNGCSVYYDRPYACRMFPIERGILDRTTTGDNKIINFFKPPIFCKGQFENKEWTVETWLKNQQVDLYQTMTIKWSKIKKLFSNDPWGFSKKEKMKMAFTSVYNLDEFRKFIFNSSFLKRYKINNIFLKKIKKNEIDLLKLGFEWIKLSIWEINSPIIKIKNQY